MAGTEAEVATKAPESDAQEDVPTTSDVVADATPDAPAASEEPAQPKMGENCHTDRPTRASAAVPLLITELTRPAQPAA